MCQFLIYVYIYACVHIYSRICSVNNTGIYIECHDFGYVLTYVSIYMCVHIYDRICSVKMYRNTDRVSRFRVYSDVCICVHIYNRICSVYTYRNTQSVTIS